MTAAEDGKALRKVVFNDRMDVVVARVAFGEASQPQLVEFPARYVLQLAGGVQCHRRMREPGFRQLLLWRTSNACGHVSVSEREREREREQKHREKTTQRARTVAAGFATRACLSGPSLSIKHMFFF